MISDEYRVEQISDNEILLPQNGTSGPIVIKNSQGTDFVEFAKNNQVQLDQYLTMYGAILFKSFNIGGVDGFNQILPSIFDEQIEYKQRTSPRHSVLGNIYTSTDHPSDQVIHMHTESSYATKWAKRICFYSNVPPAEGGETPIADVRKVLGSINPEVVDKFERKGVKYVRNIMPGVGMSWKEVYQVEDKSELIKILNECGMEYTWVDEDHLRLEWVRPAFQFHKESNQKVWFNHAFFYSKYLLDEIILEVIPEEDLPFSTYYGDGDDIEKEVIEEIKMAYSKHMILNKWEKDDVLLLDNMLFAHGRMPFKGDREILVAMGNPAE
ncbi:TauD/TfdA family dioxygenase [Fulvivirga kasyanovii]|uniref:TauD/TfdA family dioxygenase n=1 Tax=Fulvivirga kasyanovii TaxID=396812 RepID=A0ABW9RPL6_9BACT|nr:TauD/TfdA family dioxygenase [Fulvivirga kasyanovii]MTI26092.1 TauD/TfdA family dioxygenase [Fulvivirga kasyanovii]